MSKQPTIFESLSKLNAARAEYAYTFHRLIALRTSLNSRIKTSKTFLQETVDDVLGYRPNSDTIIDNNAREDIVDTYLSMNKERLDSITAIEVLDSCLEKAFSYKATENSKQFSIYQYPIVAENYLNESEMVDATERINGYLEDVHALGGIDSINVWVSAIIDKLDTVTVDQEQIAGLIRFYK